MLARIEQDLREGGRQRRPIRQPGSGPATGQRDGEEVTFDVRDLEHRAEQGRQAVVRRAWHDGGQDLGPHPVEALPEQYSEEVVFVVEMEVESANTHVSRGGNLGNGRVVEAALGKDGAGGEDVK